MGGKAQAGKANLDGRLLALATLPVLLLCLALALSWAWTLRELQFQAQVSELKSQAAVRFQDSTRWTSQKNFEMALSDLPWSQAFLRDSQGARIWQQDRHHSAPDRFQPPFVVLPLDSQTQLHLKPLPLTAEAQKTLRGQFLLALLAAILGGGVIGLMIYFLLARRWQKLQSWLEQLESGRLDSPAPRLGGLADSLGEAIAILARRLRYSREALSQQWHPPQVSASSRNSPAVAPDSSTEDRHQKDRLRERAELVSAMSHELRTPLTAISGFSELLEKSDLDPEQRDYAQTIRKSAKGLVGMINDLLDLERADAGRMTVHETVFDARDSVEDTIALLAPLAYEKRLELISIVDHDVPARLRGDAHRLQQILTNLISNAIKFTEQGEVQVRVQRERDSEQGSWIRFQVSDTGAGLSPDQQKRLFTAFQRFEDSEREIANGSGLGLMIVQRLSELLRGRIEVHSTQGVGSSFAVILPLHSDEDIASNTSWEALRGRHAWVLESNASCERALQHQLAFWQVHTRHFQSASEMQRTLAHVAPERRPDLLLLGLRADETGETAVQALLEQEIRPAVVLVNSIDSALQRELRQAGARDVLPRCSERSRLYRAITDALAPDSDQVSDKLLEGQTVLVVENNSASRHYLRALLASLGAVPYLAESGEQGFELWQQEQPRFLLLDRNMPGKDGLQLTQDIRRQEGGTSHAVIIGMSAYLSPDEERQWRAAGIDGLLSKPFDEGQLLRCLHPWLRSDQAQNPASSDKPKAVNGALTEKLLADPELSSMIIDELPQQLQELDQAFIADDLEHCRSAAHQLHGTAAFFHLEPLKSQVGLLEKRLKEIANLKDHLRLREDMATISETVHELTQSLKQRRQGESTAP